MADENKLIPKAVSEKVTELQKEVEELKDTCAALLIAMKDIIKFNGRSHMPEGNYMGEEF